MTDETPVKEEKPLIDVNKIEEVNNEDKKKLRLIQVLYGTGHILNDLCAASWFSYMLVFFERVALLSGAASGALVLLGQVVDALTTPLVGIGCDMSAASADPAIPGDAVRKRLPWHLFGSILVALSYPGLFIQDSQYTYGSSNIAVFMWYAVFVTFFQIGWATVQISHLALIPDLSVGKASRKTSLNATRYAATVLSTVAVYTVAWALLGTAGDDSNSGDNSTSSDETNNLTRANHVQFKILATFITVTGIVFTLLIFQNGMRYVTKKYGHLLADPQSPMAGNTAKTKDTTAMWLHCRKFYYVGMMYMCTRLLVNMTQTYLALYLLDTLEMEKTSIATTPLVLYAASLTGTAVIGKIVKKLGHNKSYAVAIAGCLAAAAAMYSIPKDQSWLIYPTAAGFGLSSSLLMVSCLTIVAKLIGDLPGSAFVYGAFSFSDKMSSGIVIMIIQTVDLGVSDEQFYRLVVGVMPAFVAVLALLFVFLCNRTSNPTSWEDYSNNKNLQSPSGTPTENVINISYGTINADTLERTDDGPQNIIDVVRSTQLTDHFAEPL
eukprot:TRINITY_DN22484_c0_g1_i1.p1 TRINITY_DN22484_c0_g1~~TRINITY_DN22484_c0_g1_i1.p1  ORF type:complete len:550 (+),score=115.94 TRINITY_DN22484_c0_g1_i1:45-1694(+)